MENKIGAAWASWIECWAVLGLLGPAGELGSKSSLSLVSIRLDLVSSVNEHDSRYKLLQTTSDSRCEIGIPNDSHHIAHQDAKRLWHEVKVEGIHGRPHFVLSQYNGPHISATMLDSSCQVGDCVDMVNDGY